MKIEENLQKTKDVLDFQTRFYENSYSNNILLEELSTETVLDDNQNKFNKAETEKLGREFPFGIG